MYRKQIFKACRTDKVEIVHATLEAVGSAQNLLGFMYKKDPEGRNPIVLCLVSASPNVLGALFDILKDVCDMRELILKQEYDSNPAFILALSL